LARALAEERAGRENVENISNEASGVHLAQ
jgi:hypothetical protein